MANAQTYGEGVEFTAQVPEEFERVVGWRLADSPSPAAYQEQMRAGAGFDASGEVGNITCPTLVIHGKADPLVPVDAGRDTAEHIPGAELLLIDGMGHDLAPGVQRLLLPAIDAHCRRHEPRMA